MLKSSSSDNVRVALRRGCFIGDLEFPDLNSLVPRISLTDLRRRQSLSFESLDRSIDLGLVTATLEVMSRQTFAYRAFLALSKCGCSTASRCRLDFGADRPDAPEIFGRASTGDRLFECQLDLIYFRVVVGLQLFYPLFFLVFDSTSPGIFFNAGAS